MFGVRTDNWLVSQKAIWVGVVRHLASRGSRRGVSLLKGGGLFDFDADMGGRVEERGQGPLLMSEEEMSTTWLVPTYSNLSCDSYPCRREVGHVQKRKV